MGILPTKEQRIHNQFKMQIRKFTFKQYDEIVSMCESAVKSFGTERLPLSVVNEYVDKAMILTTDNSAAMQTKVDGFNESLRIFKKVLKFRSEERMKDNKIGIEEIKHFVSEFKKALIDSQEQDVVLNK